MFAANKILALTFITAVFFIHGVSAAARYTQKPDSDFINAPPANSGRRLDSYTPRKSNYTVTMRGSSALGYYYATMFVGSPPQMFTVIVDTGSSITAIPCNTCTQCGTTHANKFFNPAASSHFSDVACNASIENFQCSDCTGSDCRFYIGYSEGSYYNGTYGSDMMGLSDEIEAFFYGKSSMKASQILDTFHNLEGKGYFGCVSQEGGLFSTQMADGIFGLGLKSNTAYIAPNLVDVLSDSNPSLYANAFSVCLSPKGGYLTLGGLNKQYLNKTDKPIVVQYSNWGQYYIGLHGLSMDGEQVANQSDFDAGTGKFVDSGTTMLYVTSTIRKKIGTSMNSFCNKSSSNCGGAPSIQLGADTCYKRDKTQHPDVKDFYATFPKFSFALDHNQDYTLTAAEYLFARQDGESNYCLGFYDNGSRIVLGAIFMKNHDFHFDKDNQYLTIQKSDCGALMSSAPSGTKVAIDWGL